MSITTMPVAGLVIDDETGILGFNHGLNGE